MTALPRAATALFLTAFSPLTAQDARIEVDASQQGHTVSRWLTGACIEDVNHEVYGGIYSQMVFGESFQEAAPTVPPDGFTAHGGSWQCSGGVLRADGPDGPKLLAKQLDFTDGKVSTELRFAGKAAGSAGLILRVTDAATGADRFTGYEVSLDPTQGIARLGRHRQNWEPIIDVPCPLPVDQWIQLTVTLTGPHIEVAVDGRTVIRHDDTALALARGAIGLRPWQRSAEFRNLVVTTAEKTHPLPFASDPAASQHQVSGMWRLVQRGDVHGRVSLATDHPFAGRQSQHLEMTGGSGQFGIENQGLNRWGMQFHANQPYEAVIWARATTPTTLWASLESADGTRTLAESPLAVAAGPWQRLTFTLTPSASTFPGRFTLTLRAPGAVTLGHAWLQPGPWGRFQNLPVRRDVAEGLIDQGITALRYGGLMANHRDYRWKNMRGPRDQRPPYEGFWYPHSSNGWGILDFLEFCEAAGFEAIPDFNSHESPADMADFVEYATGSIDTPWGKRRAEDGRSQPYPLKYLQIGNEERVDDAYASRFEGIANAVWKKHPNLILIVGDFAYYHPIHDPFQITGASSGITTLAPHQRILQLAKTHQREIWFDVHIGTDGPRPDAALTGTFSFIDALARIADGARHKVVVLEFNAGNHSLRRALANALAINAIERDGRIPFALSANCLQPDGQNDNGWNQGLLFLNPSAVWLQPPGHVTRMFSRHFQPILTGCRVIDPAGNLDATAKRSADGTRLVLQVVNSAAHPVPATLAFAGFNPATATALTLTGPLDAANTAARPDHCRPTEHAFSLTAPSHHHTFPPHSVTVLSLQQGKD